MDIPGYRHRFFNTYRAMDSPILDDDDREFLKFMDNQVPANPLAKRQVVPELQKLVMLLTQRPGYIVKDVFRGGHELTLCRKRGSDDGRKRKMERRETCRVLFHRFWSKAEKDKQWDLQDSMALFVSLTSALPSLREAPDFLIVVVPGKVAVRARNAGFSAQAKHRILPLSVADVEAVDTSLEGRRRAPKLADAQTVADALHCDLTDMVDLPLLSVADSAVLWDLDMLIGSYVHCPPLHLSFRVVAAALED